MNRISSKKIKHERTTPVLSAMLVDESWNVNTAESPGRHASLYSDTLPTDNTLKNHNY